jgi:thioredoxin 1
LIIGLLAGAGFVGFIVYDSMKQSSARRGPATSENVVELTDANWQKEVVESKIPVLVDVTGETWCMPCKAFAPTVNRLADKYKGKVKVAKFDVGNKQFDRGQKLVEQYGISGVPHIMIFNGGNRPIQVFDKGAPSESALSKILDSLLASSRPASQ